MQCSTASLYSPALISANAIFSWIGNFTAVTCQTARGCRAQLSTFNARGSTHNAGQVSLQAHLLPMGFNELVELHLVEVDL